MAQLLYIKGIGHEAHVKHQVRLHGQAVFEAEGRDADRHAALFSRFSEQPQQLASELGRGQPGGVDDEIRPLLHRLHDLPLRPDRRLQ